MKQILHIGVTVYLGSHVLFGIGHILFTVSKSDPIARAPNPDNCDFFSEC
jgi:hypothetical protein